MVDLGQRTDSCDGENRRLGFTEADDFDQMPELI